MSNQRVDDRGVVDQRDRGPVMASQNEQLLAALKRLSSAALARDATMGDPCRLLEVCAELAAANRQAMAAIAAAGA